MKKTLIASTVLVLSAGFAAADTPTLTGNARMGVRYDGSDMQFTSRVRASIAMAGTTDGGLSFGGSFDVHNAGISVSRTSIGPDLVPGTADDTYDISGGAAAGQSGSVFLSGAFGKISMGDVDSAVQASVGQVDQKSLLVLDGPQEINHIGGGASFDDPAMLYTYTTGSLTFALGAKDGTVDDRFSVGAKYATDKFSVGVGFADDGTVTETSIGGSATLGAATVKLVLNSRDDTDLAYAMSVSGTFSGVGVTAFYRDGDALAEANIGVGASYDLGGGATVVGSVGSVSGTTLADLGVSFSF